jgi:hypothetical protein
LTEETQNQILQEQNVANLRTDRYARTGDLKLGLFDLKSPHFLTLIKSAREFSILSDLISYSPDEHHGGCVIRLFDAPRIIGERYKNRKQL